MRRAVGAVLVAAVLLAPAPASAAPLIPGMSQVEWDAMVTILHIIADMRLDGGNGLRPLMNGIYDMAERVAPLSKGSRLLWKFAQDFQELKSLHDDIKSDVENLVDTTKHWDLSPRTMLLRQLYVDPIDVGKVMLSRIFGDIPNRMPGAYLHDAVGFTVASTQSFSSRRMNDSAEWSRQFSDMYRRSSEVRRSPGEAMRDHAHNMAAKVAVDASNAQILTQTLTVRQMDAALDDAEARSSSLLATALVYDMANRPLQLPTDPPLKPFATPTPEPTSTPEPSDGGDGGGGDESCSRTFGNNVAYGDVMGAIDQWKGQHPDWYKPNGAGQDIVDGEHWDDYYGGVVANLNKNPGLVARVDPCDCGEIQVRRRGDSSVSDQYHILTSWGQIRHDQNAYRDTCYPAAF